MAITNPTVLINEYISEKVMDSLPNSFTQKFRFFPQLPTDINSITDDMPEAADNIFVVYDRMFKMRNRAFPHIKNEQALYYFYKMAGLPDDLYDTVQIVYDLLDREDESGQEINQWLQSKIVNDVITVNNKDFKPVFFHSFKVYQLQETRDTMNHGTVRTFAGSKIIVDYKYHTQDYTN